MMVYERYLLSNMAIVVIYFTMLSFGGCKGCSLSNFLLQRIENNHYSLEFSV